MEIVKRWVNREGERCVRVIESVLIADHRMYLFFDREQGNKSWPTMLFSVRSFCPYFCPEWIRNKLMEASRSARILQNMST